MKAFVSWSGGKDCTLALYRFVKNIPGAEIILLNMIRQKEGNAHGLDSSFVQAQAKAMQVSLLQPLVTGSYEQNFKEVLHNFKQQGIETGIFGDIYLQEHRAWIERACSACGIKAEFPLWNEDTTVLMQEFVNAGFKTIVIAVHKEKLEASFLGKEINPSFVDKIKIIPNVDVCGENGEYHTFVFDGPLFKYPVSFIKENVIERGNHYFLNLKQM